MKWIITILYTLWCYRVKSTTAMGICLDNSSLSTAYVTRGGTAPHDSQCCFPFEYQGKKYSGCILTEHKRPWCSIDSIYADRWGNCVASSVSTGGCISDSKESEMFHVTPGTVMEGTPCCFPFWFEGVWYSKCITSSGRQQHWCAVDSIYSDENARWGTCYRRRGSTSIPTPKPTGILRPSTTIVPHINTTGAPTKDPNAFNIPIAAIVAPVAACFLILIIIITVVLCRIRQYNRTQQQPEETGGGGYYEYVGLGPNTGKLEDSSLPKNRYSSQGEITNITGNLERQNAKVYGQENVVLNTDGQSAGYLKPM